MIKELEKTNANGNKTPSNHLQDCWVVNKSDRELTSDESSLLCKRMNYAVSPDKIPVGDLITRLSVETACHKIDNKTTARGSGPRLLE